MGPDEATAGPPTDKAAALLALHAGDGFVLPNAWDAGSARILEQVGFPAIATTSAGIAWSCGVPDGEALDRDTMLDHVGRIAAAVRVPVTADLEAGYGTDAEEVGRTVAAAVALGWWVATSRTWVRTGSSGSTRRWSGSRPPVPLRPGEPSCSTPAPTRTSPRRAGDPFAETVERANRYLEAGADCIFVPGVVEGRPSAASPRPSRARSTSWPASRTSSMRRPSSLSASRGSVWAAAWREQRSPSWSAQAGSWSTPGRWASSTARCPTPTCNDASRDRSRNGRRPGPGAAPARESVTPATSRLRLRALGLALSCRACPLVRRGRRHDGFHPELRDHDRRAGP